MRKQKDYEKYFSRKIRKTKIKKVLKYIVKIITSEKTTAFVLSVMAIVISVVSLRIDSTSQKTAQKEFEILENDREAYFSLKEEFAFKYFDNVQSYERIVKCTVCNTGGYISGAYLRPSSYLDIYISEYGDLINAKIYRLPIFEFCSIEDRFLELYNSEDRSFEFYLKESSQLDNFVSQLRKTLEELNSDCAVSIYRTNIVNISYSNFENIKKDIQYEVNYNSLIVVDDSDKNIEFVSSPTEMYDDIEVKAAAKVVTGKFKVSLNKLEQSVDQTEK